MASIAEHDDVESQEYENNLFQNYLQKGRRRGSTCFTSESEILSDDETTDVNASMIQGQSRPDYMNLGDFGEEATLSRFGSLNRYK